MKTTHWQTCDYCKRGIVGPIKQVELNYYGLVFHPTCFVVMTGRRLLELMGEDETCVRKPTQVLATGDINGPIEKVDW